MPKRKLEEVESFFSPMQMKTQVGPRHLTDPKFMKEIYDRTLSLLRAGATKQFEDGDLEKMSSALHTPNPSREASPPSRCLSPLPPDGSVSGMETPMMCSSGENSPLKIVGDFSAMIQEETSLDAPQQLHQQLCIDSQGKLTKSSMQHSALTSSTNRCCGKYQSDPPNQCSFCEKGLCQDCFRVCVNCRHYFCSVCSLLEYRDGGEETVCLTCQSSEMM